MECCIPPGFAVAVTVTVKVSGPGGLLPPPQAAAKTATKARTQSIAKPRRRPPNLPAKARPRKEIGKHKAYNPFADPANSGWGAKAAVRPAALTVSVDGFPGVTDVGNSAQVGIGVELPLTEHFKSMFPAKPPCAANVNPTLPCPPRLTVRLVTDAVMEKSGTVTSRLEPLSEVSGSGASDETETELVIVPAVVGVAPKLTVAFADTASVPSAQLMTPFAGAAQLPWLACTDPMVAMAGTMSVNATFVACAGPLFLTVIV